MLDSLIDYLIGEEKNLNVWTDIASVVASHRRLFCEDQAAINRTCGGKKNKRSSLDTNRDESL
jgi:hypothetical protein